MVFYRIFVGKHGNEGSARFPLEIRVILEHVRFRAGIGTTSRIARLFESLKMLSLLVHICVGFTVYIYICIYRNIYIYTYIHIYIDT